MKKLCFSFLLVLIIHASSFAQKGTVSRSLVLKSAILNKEMKYSIYLPLDYDKNNETYPVLYLLHGYGDNENAWIDYGKIFESLNQDVLTRLNFQMIIVMPDALKTYYMNNYNGSVKYEDYFFKEFIPHIESVYRIKKSKNYRAISGLSMGGFGSFLYALKYPEYFKVVAPLSSAVRTDEELVSMKDSIYNRSAYAYLLGSNLKGRKRLNKTWYENAIIHLINNSDADSLKSIKWYIDCGDDDYLLNGNIYTHLALAQKRIPHELRIRNGEHNWKYWQVSFVDVYQYIAHVFKSEYKE
ncbi:alpha/beta hydrolase [Pedobacter puniceum]|nr:alpha/beta hydrolase family protein [Pedobacter puniceum]